MNEIIEQIKDKNNNLIYFKDNTGYEYWGEFDENNNQIYFKNNLGFEYWLKYNKNNEKIEITEKEYKEIKLEKEEKKKRNCFTRFEIMDI